MADESGEHLSVVTTNTGTGSGGGTTKSKWAYNTGGSKPINYNYDAATNTYEVDMSDWSNEGFDNYRDSSSGNPKYFWKDSGGKKHYVDSKDDAPRNATLYKADANLVGLAVSDDSPLRKTNESGTGKWGNSEYTRVLGERKQAAIDYQTSANIAAQEQKNADAAAAAEKAKQQAAAKAKNALQKKLNDMSFAEYATDATFNINDGNGTMSTSEQLLQKAKDEGLTYDELMQAVKGTKWEKNTYFLQYLEKYYPKIDRDEERKRVWEEFKIDYPKTSFDDFEKLYAADDEKVKAVKNRMAERKQFEADEKARKEAEAAEAEAKRLAELEEARKNAESEAEQRRADAELKKQAREFEAKYPWAIAQFWNPGWSKGQKWALLGEILSNIASNTINGAVAGFNKTSYTPTKGRTQQYLDEAYGARNKRNQTILDEDAKSQANRIRRDSIIDSSNLLSGLSNEERSKVQTLFEGKTATRAEFYKALGEFRTPEEKEEMYEEYKRAKISYEEGSDKYSKTLDNEQKETTLKFSQLQNYIKNEQDANSFVQSLMEEKKKLQSQLLDVDKMKEADYWQACQYVMNFIGGIQTAQSQGTHTNSVSNYTNNNAGWNFSGNANLGNGFVGLGISGGYQNMTATGQNATVANGSVSGKQMDVLRSMNIKTAEKNGNQYIEDTKENREALKKSIQEQIDKIDNELLPQAEELRDVIKAENKNTITMHDGIVKGKGVAQKIVRADGQVINLDPDDNIYATKNDITTANDDGEDVVPMEQNETLEYQKRLGYTEGSSINKDFDYYLEMMRRA